MRRPVLTVIPGLLALLALLLAASASASTVTRPFQTPSGNIKCEGFRLNGVYGLRCDVYSHSWKAPKQTRPCDAGDYGSSLSMSASGRVRWPCVGDATDPGPRLGYGRSWSFGPFRCTSRTTGLTCRNAGRHGWFLARGSYSVS
jgi:hypothetical protein